MRAGVASHLPESLDQSPAGPIAVMESPLTLVQLWSAVLEWHPTAGKPAAGLLPGNDPAAASRCPWEIAPGTHNLLKSFVKIMKSLQLKISGPIIFFR
jgi:hypothetical protein